MARWLRGTRWKVRTGLIGGVAILLLVDIIWVGSAGLTRVKVTFDDLLPHHFINAYCIHAHLNSFYLPRNLMKSHSSRHTLRPLSFPSILWRSFSGVHGNDSVAGRCADVEGIEKQLQRGTVQHLNSQWLERIVRMMAMLLKLHTRRITWQ